LTRNTYNLQDKVIFEGPKNQRELFSFYTRANMFILSSIREGLPCVLLEAQAFGIPIIATNISDIPYAILNNKTGILVPPADSIAIREAIHMLLDDPKFGEEIGKQAHLRMKKDFDWNRIGRNLEKTYEELVACPRIKKQ
jgi:glycosyltransferase involved in cell wall biosynthesis